MRDDPQGGDGMKQLGERAKGQEAERDAAFHRYHEFELVVGALQIAIVLASVSVVTRGHRTRVGCRGDWVHRSDLWCAGRPRGDLTRRHDDECEARAAAGNSCSKS